MKIRQIKFDAKIYYFVQVGYFNLKCKYDQMPCDCSTQMTMAAKKL